MVCKGDAQVPVRDRNARGWLFVVVYERRWLVHRGCWLWRRVHRRVCGCGDWRCRRLRWPGDWGRRRGWDGWSGRRGWNGRRGRRGRLRDLYLSRHLHQELRRRARGVRRCRRRQMREVADLLVRSGVHVVGLLWNQPRMLAQRGRERCAEGSMQHSELLVRAERCVPVSAAVGSHRAARSRRVARVRRGACARAVLGD